MPCNVSANRRRVIWGYPQEGNATAGGQFSWALGSVGSREYWFEMDTVQTDPWWLWLNGGFILPQIGLGGFPGNALWQKTLTAGTRVAQLSIGGSAGSNPIPIAPSMTYSCILTIVKGLNPVTDLWIFATQKDVDLPKSDYILDFPLGWVVIKSGSPAQAAPLGEPIITPLKCGHDCT